MSYHYFLRCTYCDHLNPFKTEYLTFCESCGRKLNNNFNDWIKQHPGKTITDFRKEVCISRDAGVATIRNDSTKTVSDVFALPSKKRMRPAARLALIAFVATALLLTFVLLSPTPIEDIFLRKQIPAVTEQKDWNDFEIGVPPLTFESPFKAETYPEDAPAPLREWIKQHEAVRIRPSRSLDVIISSSSLTKNMSPALQSVAYAVIKDYVDRKGVQMVEFKESPVMSSSVHGISMEGSCHEDGIFKRFRFLIFVHQSQLYVIKGFILPGDPAAGRTMERIFDSVVVDLGREQV